MTTDEGAHYVIEVTHDNDHPVIRLSGEFDLRAAPELRGTLLDLVGVTSPAPDNGPVRAVFLDMTALTFLDSTIISVLLMATKRAADTAGMVGLVSVPARVQRVLDIAGVSDVLPIFPTLAAGQESLSA